MSHWFHRNLLKATTIVNYHDVFKGGLNQTKLANDLKQARDRLLEMLPEPSNNLDSLNTAYTLYMSLMSGFLSESHLGGNKDLRYSVEYKWSHTLRGQGAESCKDVVFDMCNMSINVAIWHMKHASYVSSKANVDMADAKEVYTSLRKGAGILEMVKKDLLPLLQQNSKPGSDLDPRVLTAYLKQCTAEAQEVTVARAIELKHNKSLISALASDTSNTFQEAVNHLKEVDKTISEQWRLYLTIKRNIYLSYAYCYSGHNSLDENQCGDAIRSLRESEKYYKTALELCKPYAKVKGPARPVKPQGHSFFNKVSSLVTITLEKCERENGFIYHQKVPEHPPDLETKATYGLAAPEEFSLPPPAPIWVAVAEDMKAARPTETSPKTNTNKTPKNKSPGHEEEEKLPEVKEAKADASKENPSNDHGCVVQ